MKPIPYYEMSDGTQPQYPQMISKPFLKRNHSSAEAKEYSAELEVYEKEKETYNSALTKYNTEKYRRADEFKKDLLREFGVTDNPKADMCFSIAYDKGHSSGFQEVYNQFSDIVELIK